MKCAALPLGVVFLIISPSFSLQGAAPPAPGAQARSSSQTSNAGLRSISSSPAPGRLRAEPKEIDTLLANPGMGWQTFHRFADDDKNLDGLPSGSAYFRFYWRDIEPEAGRIDFGKFDDLLAQARRAGQKLAFRIMCTGSGQYMDVPAWLKEQGCRGFEFTFEGRKHWVPDFADARFQEAHFRLIHEFGRKYDGHPDLDLVDIGSVGLWGEWHMSGTKRTDNGQPVALPEPSLLLAIIDEWYRAFPRTSKVILIGSEVGMSQAVDKGYGWRADCLGDMGGFSKTWNHMDNFYLQQLEKTRAQDAWKTGPVAFESCWDMRKWKESGWDIRHIFDYGLRCHASYMNNKSAPIPEGTRGEVERFLRRLGYRLVVRAVEHDASVRPGSNLTVAIDWENVGVAPPYRDYYVGLQLKPSNKSGSAPWTSLGARAESIRGWAPGKRRTSMTLPLPQLQTGRYELALAVVEKPNQQRTPTSPGTDVPPQTWVPAVQLAIAGRAQDGWYPISEIQVTP